MKIKNKEKAGNKNYAPVIGINASTVRIVDRYAKKLETDGKSSCIGIFCT